MKCARLFYLFTAFLGLAFAYECPDPNGFFPHPSQCDKYYECKDDEATEKLCEDGYVFNIKGSDSKALCDSPFSVDCSSRPELQEPTTSENCPRKNGLFPEEGDCRSFWNCIEGLGTISSCPHGLVFNDKKGTCDWPDSIDRDCSSQTKKAKKIYGGEKCEKPYGSFPDKDDCRSYWTCVNSDGARHTCPDGLVFNDERAACDWPDSIESCKAEDVLGFKCPDGTPKEQGGYRYYPHPEDCRKHFACIRGAESKVLLRLLTCGYGNVYDIDTESCLPAKSVEGCEDYYPDQTTTTASSISRQRGKKLKTTTEA